MLCLGILGQELKKTSYCHIWNQHPQTCQIAKFCEKPKVLTFVKKIALFGYFWVIILKTIALFGYFCVRILKTIVLYENKHLQSSQNGKLRENKIA